MYRVEYLRNEPFAIRRLSDGFLIPLSKDGFALDEWVEFEAWNKEQTPPLDYTSTQAEKTEESFKLPIHTPQLITEEVILQSPKPRDKPKDALIRAKDIIKLKNKPIGEMLFNLLVVVADVVSRLEDLERRK